METEELTKLVDGIYKNILDKFNPGARQMIIAGKAYLKALHGAAAASRMYVEAVGKLGRQAQQGTWGGSADIGTALMKVVEVYREIQDQQMNILKAFYVDLLVPLETNLEKDTKVVQSEQKRFLQQHKLRSESYSKAAATIKKQRKKTRNPAKAGSAMDKEMKSMQVLEEEKTKLDAFCEQSLKNAMTQERRRYGFVLERQCSLAKHWLAYHSSGVSTYTSGLEEWLDVARTREFLPPNVEAMFVSRMRQVSFWADEEVYASPRACDDDDDRASVGSALRKTRSVDASCLDVRSIAELGSPQQGLSRAKSDFNLQASLHSLEQDPSTETAQQRRPMSLAPGAPSSGWETPLARALYAYHSTGENQLSFMEGDVVALVGDRTKGWQYGENLRTHQAGWFPLAYTEMMLDDHNSSPARWGTPAATPGAAEPPPPAPVTHAAPATPATPAAPAVPPANRHPPARMFGDTITAHRVSKTRLPSGSPGLPPTLPAPVPNSTPKMKSSMSSTFANPPPTPAMKNSTSSASFTTQARIETKHFPPQTLPVRGQQPVNKAIPPKGVATAGVGGVGNVSLHSSNDSGFSNEPPPQPEVDYSDEEGHRSRMPISKPGQYTPEQRAYLLKTQSLKRPAKSNGVSIGKQYMVDDQQIMLRTMMDFDRDSQKVKRTKSFWKFGRTTSEEIMEGMSLWQHRDIVDTVPEYKKRLYAKMQEAIQAVTETTEPRKKSVERPTYNDLPHPQETIDRKDLKIGNGIRQSKSLSSIQNGNSEIKLPNDNSYDEDTKNKSMPDKPMEEKEQFIDPICNEREDTRSNNSDMTNTSTIKTNFENSFYNDENGEGFVVKTVKRREILQRYDNDSSSEINSVASSNDPYDCIIVDDHMTSRKIREGEKHINDHAENEIKSQKETSYMHEFEEIEIGPITPHVMSNASNDRSSKSLERSLPQRMDFKTFKDNDGDIKTFSASSETLKYKENRNNGDRYDNTRREKSSHDKRKEEIYNGLDDDTLKYKKQSSKEEKVDRRRDYEEQKKKEYTKYEGRSHKNEHPYQRESEQIRPNERDVRKPSKDQFREPTREQMRDARGHARESREHAREPIREQREMREPRKEFDVRDNRKETSETRKRERPNRSYDDSSLKYNGRREGKQYEANLSYFSDQERRDSRYEYDTDSKKAAKSRRHEEHAKRYMDQQINGKYSEQSDDQKFDEVLKQQKPQLLPRTKLLKSRSQLDSLEHLPMSGHTFGPWYDLWGREREAVAHK